MSSVNILRTVLQVRQWRHQKLVQNLSVGFVPTMGALHDGHLSLVSQSLKENDSTVVSIFVNPSQFAPHEDLDGYPRTVESDLAILAAKFASKTVDAVFIPKVLEIYPSGIHLELWKQKGAFVTVLGCSEQLEGVTRPQFFRGVATVVTKFLNVVRPTRVYFGQKDAQQCVVIKNLVKDLLIDTEVRVMPTLREKTGLAMSSRNAYLSSQTREESAIIYQAISAGKDYYQQHSSEGEVSAEAIYKVIKEVLRQKTHFAIEYIAINHPQTLEELQKVIPGTGALISTAVRVQRDNGDTTRLIDNIVVI